MNNSDTSITESLISQIATVSFRIDSTLTMSGLSETLRHYLPDADASKMTDVFEIVRPSGAESYDELKNTFGAMVLMTAKDQSFAVRGQFIDPPDMQGCLMFVGSPWLSWITQNADASKIRMKDFASTDVQLDQLIFLSTEQQNLNDLKELTEELKTARDEAEQFNAVQSKFFALMSHEMRTPLNGVATALDLIDDKQLQGESLKMLKIARSSGSNLKRVINQVLNYSKLQAGGFANEPRSFDLRRTLSSVVDMHTPSANQQGNQLVLEGMDKPSFFIADEQKLKQVLINLVGNALKFTTDGKVSISVDFDEQSEQLTISVADNGEGIPEALQPKIFESYWTFDSNRREHKGTGLGLNICKQFVEIMGGQISFESRPGEGTEFAVKLPASLTGPVGKNRKEYPDLEYFMGPQAVNQTEIDSVPQFSGKVLLVEDNLTNQYLSQLLLERRGLHVDLAGNGVEAINQVGANNYDLVFMDISMPIMDGMEATQKLRETYSKEQLPIVAMTAHAGHEYLSRFIAAGMNDAMSKPVDLLVLNETLAQWCEPAERLAAGKEDAGKEAKNKKPQENQEAAAMDARIFDPEEAGKLCEELDAELFIQIADVFQAEARERLAEILETHQTKDAENLAKKSHSIRSSAATLGCMALANQLKRIELAARDSDWDGLKDDIEGLSDLMTNSLGKLKDHMLNLAG